MATVPFSIFPLGDSALTVEFGDKISVDLNKNAIALADHVSDNGFCGFVEAVPAYASTSIFYDLVAVRKAFPEFATAFEAVSNIVETTIEEPLAEYCEEERYIEIPVNFDGGSALDLEFVASNNGLSTDAVIEVFTSQVYRVFMLGFLPGFAYMGEVDERIATPRRDSPRENVPKGSVGIAGTQTGIYSLNSPGGWQIIGRTNVGMFTPDGESPAYLRPGDSIRFVPAK
ncbi:MAG: 5-oxoprolinase subunit PxpB [Pyrinomonadaceae bacterium]